MEASLERTGLDRFDILYCHDIDEASDEPEILDAHLRTYLGPDGGYKALEMLRSGGVVGAIGLGVNSWQTCEFHARDTDVDLFLLAGRFTLLEQEALDSLLPLCLTKGIQVVIGGPYNSGILATGPVEGALYNYVPASADVRQRVARIEEICAEHSVRLIDAALQFPLRHDAVVSVIPGGMSGRQLRENAASLAAPIPESLWDALLTAGLLHPCCADMMERVA